MHAAVLFEKSWDFCCLGTLPSDNKIDARNFVSSKEKIALYHSINTLGALVPVHRLPGQQEWKSIRVFPLTSTWWWSPWNIRRLSLDTMCWFILYSVFNCLSRQSRHYKSKSNLTRSRVFPWLLSKGYCFFKHILKKPAVKKSNGLVQRHLAKSSESLQNTCGNLFCVQTCVPVDNDMWKWSMCTCRKIEGIIPTAIFGLFLQMHKSSKYVRWRHQWLILALSVKNSILFCGN